MQDPKIIIMFVVLLVVGLFFLIFFLMLAKPWLRAILSGAPVSIIRILAMRLRGNSPKILLDAYIILKLRQIEVTIDQVEHVYIDYKNSITTTEELIEHVMVFLESNK